jgi:hypothetical protein
VAFTRRFPFENMPATFADPGDAVACADAVAGGGVAGGGVAGGGVVGAAVAVESWWVNAALSGEASALAARGATRSTAAIVQPVIVSHAAAKRDFISSPL